MTENKLEFLGEQIAIPVAPRPIQEWPNVKLATLMAAELLGNARLDIFIQMQAPYIIAACYTGGNLENPRHEDIFRDRDMPLDQQIDNACAELVGNYLEDNFIVEVQEFDAEVHKFVAKYLPEILEKINEEEHE